MKHFDISIKGTRVKLTIYFSWKRLAEGFRTNPRSSGSAHSFSRYEACKIGRWDVVIYWGSCDEEDRKGDGAAVERKLVGSNTTQRALYAPSGTKSSALTSPSPHNSPPQRIQGPGGFDGHHATFRHNARCLGWRNQCISIVCAPFAMKPPPLNSPDQQLSNGGIRVSIRALVGEIRPGA